MIHAVCVPCRFDSLLYFFVCDAGNVRVFQRNYLQISTQSGSWQVIPLCDGSHRLLQVNGSYGPNENQTYIAPIGRLFVPCYTKMKKNTAIHEFLILFSLHSIKFPVIGILLH